MVLCHSSLRKLTQKLYPCSPCGSHSQTASPGHSKSSVLTHTSTCGSPTPQPMHCSPRALRTLQSQCPRLCPHWTGILGARHHLQGNELEGFPQLSAEQCPPLEGATHPQEHHRDHRYQPKDMKVWVPVPLEKVLVPGRDGASGDSVGDRLGLV